MPNAASALVAALCGIFVALYLRGWLQLRTERRAPATWRPVSFVAGVIAGVLATMSPLAAGAEARLSGHMVQHLALVYVVAPLIVFGRPVRISLAGISRRWRRSFAQAEGSRAVRTAKRALLSPIVVTSVVVAGLWVWHLPSVYEAALADGMLHELEHATFIAGGFLLWSSVFSARRKRTFGSGVLVAAATSLGSGALGAVLVLASHPLYPSHAGSDALIDQQLAGALMWAPPGVIHAAAVVALAFAWLRDLDRRFGRGSSSSVEPARYTA